MRNSFIFQCVTLTAIVLTLALAANAQPTYPLFTVNSTADSVDTNPGDGICADSENRCTLRASVDEANANVGNRPIISFALAYPAVINLTLGEIHIQMADAYEYYLVGPGPRLLTVQRSPSAKLPFRIFNVTASGQNGGRLVMRGLTIKNGVGGPQFPGGGLRVGPGAIVALRKAALLNNSASLGGAIAVEGAANAPNSGLGLWNVLIASNSAQHGGALWISDRSQVGVLNSTLTDNSADEGGAIYANGTTSVINSTISHNSASLSASAIRSSSAESLVTVFNSIVGNDVSFPVTSLSGGFYSNGNNLITDARGSTGFENGIKADKVSDNNAIDAKLGALSDNGGPTDTRAPLLGSPAIDAGNSCTLSGCTSFPPPNNNIYLPDDQQYSFRWAVGAAVDIGAVEAGATPSLTDYIAWQSTSSSSPSFLLHSQALTTDLETGEVNFSGINPNGIYRFRYRHGHIYRFTFRTKRKLNFWLPQPREF